MGRSKVELRKRLLDWYRQNRRRLPWRENRDPYRILVSELMLQQTRVGTVIPYFEEFLRRFPSTRELAAAPLDDVLAAWSGLGYYRRARYLHAAARRIVDEHGGVFPKDASAVRDLPGVGRYTAGAVRSIAFDEPDPIVDGNVARVLCRLHGLDGDPGGSALGKRLWKEAGELLARSAPGDFNQALMELGALVCTPRSPDCDACPWAAACRARAQGRQEELPERPVRPRPRLEEASAVAVRRGGRWLLVRRPSDGLMAGLWELPGAPAEGAEELSSAVRRCHGLWTRIGDPVGKVSHSILNRRIRLSVYRARLLRAPRDTAPSGAWRWMRSEQALTGRIPLSGAGRKVLRLLEFC